MSTFDDTMDGIFTEAETPQMLDAVEVLAEILGKLDDGGKRGGNIGVPPLPTVEEIRRNGINPKILTEALDTIDFYHEAARFTDSYR